MSAVVRLPRLLTPAVVTGLRHEVGGRTLGEVLDNLFSTEPALRGHLLDEQGGIRPHVLIFVDGTRAELDTPIAPNAEVRVLQAVSGG